MDANGMTGKQRFSNWINRTVLVEKLDNTTGHLVLFGLSLLLTFIVLTGGLKAGTLLLLALIGLPCLYLLLFNVKAGFILVLVLAYFVLGIKRFNSEIPLGVVLDVMTGVLLVGFFLKQFRSNNWAFAKNPVTYLVLVWIGYNLFELFNPWAPSRLAWVYTVRRMAGIMVLYFVALYVIDHISYLTRIVKLWIGLSMAAAVYGLFQEFAGLQSFEMNWLLEDEQRYQLLFQWGRFRKFSFMADPTVFGILMAYTGVFCLVLMFGPFSYLKKAMLGVGAIAMFLAMTYSGTRTGYVMVPAGILFFSMITMKKEVLITGALFGLVTAFIILKPTSDPNLYRIKSAFLLQESSSYQARLTNQSAIQPAILSHPIGFGLGSTGDWGRRFSPGHFLSEFPPDSGYVRVAVELGWVGLLIYCYLLFNVLKEGIKGYFRSRNRQVKIYYLAFLTIMYMLIIADYPQQALMQFPTNLMFFISIAAIVRLNNINNNELKT